MVSLDPRAEDRYRVETPERIELEYDVAGLGSRFLAALVDTTILGVAATLILILGTMGLAAVVGLATSLLGLDEQLGGGIAFALILLLAFAVIWGYFVFFELIWHGQSPGKKWVGLRVIKEGGYPVGFVDSAIRNVVRLVDFLPFYYIVGTIVMLVDGRSRRLGDLAAGTLVVKERRDLRLDALEVKAPGPTPSSEPATAQEPQVPNLSRLTASDQSLLREYLHRRSTLAAPAAAELAARLAAAFARKLEHDLGGEAPEAFLERLSRQVGRRR